MENPPEMLKAAVAQNRNILGLELEHTPGPWYVHEHFTGSVEIRDAKENGSIADMRRNGRNMNMANAKLLSAAPELLMALRAAWQTRSEVEWLKIAPEVHEMIKNAVAAAEGIVED